VLKHFISGLSTIEVDIMKIKVSTDAKRLIVNILSLAYNICQIVRSTAKRKRNEPLSYLLLTPVTGNMGDQAIAQETMKILNGNTVELVGDSKINISLLRKIVRDDDVIVITGGGFLGSLYDVNEQFVLESLKSFNHNRIVIMPQTVYYEKEIPSETIQTYRSHKKLKFMCRDSLSFELVRKTIGVKDVYLFPDMVLLSEKIADLTPKSNVVVLLFRDDKESTNTKDTQSQVETYCREKNYLVKKLDTNIHKLVMPWKRRLTITNFLRELSEARFVVTDRLHGMIFSYITNTPCIALNNINGKVERVYKDWLINSDYILLDDSDIEKSLLQIDVLMSSNRHDDFDRYRKEIGEIAQ
jgi:pyruvyl transferase EpsI